MIPDCYFNDKLLMLFLLSSCCQLERDNFKAEVWLEYVLLKLLLFQVSQ